MESAASVKIFGCVGEMVRAMFAPVVIGVGHDEDPDPDTNAGDFCCIKQGDNNVLLTEQMLRECLSHLQSALAELEARRCKQATSDSTATSV